MGTYIHHVPGRLRVRVPGAKNNRPVAESLNRLLRSTAGVSSVDASVITGSILVHYDETETSAPAILHSLRSRGYLSAATRVSTAARLRQKMAQAVVDYVVEKAVEKAAFALVAAIL